MRLGVREVLATDFEVQEAAGREEALDLVRDIGDFDVAILDMGWRRNGDGALDQRHRDDPRDAPRRAGARRSSPTASGPSATWPTPPSAPARQPTSPARRAPEQLRKAVAAAAAQERFVDGDVPPKGSRGMITRRQREILQLLADGESTTVAARKLGLSEETVKTHMKNTLARLDARNRTPRRGDRPARILIV